MFLDPELVIKRVAIVAGAILVASAIGITVWYNLNLKTEFVEGKTETTNLRQETSRLNAETDGLKDIVSGTTKDLKNSISLNLEETKKVESEVKSQNLTLKQLQNEFDKYKVEVKTEFVKLNDQLKAKTIELDKLKVEHKNEVERNKFDIDRLNNEIKAKDKEISDTKAKLDKEIEWRTKYFWTR